MNFRRLALSALPFALCLPATASAVNAPTPRRFDVPARTEWRPDGCRSVPADNAIIGTHGRWRLLHSDIAASDEVSIALAPVFESDWHAENATFHVSVPVFDSHGNLYAVPYLPHENVALVSLDPDDGSRRWSVAGTGAPAGACAPITLDDPMNAGEDIIYVTLKDRAFAVRPDGVMVWDVPTGLTLAGDNFLDSTTGNSYLPQRDAIVGLTTGGELYLVDRSTGAQLLAAPFLMPGEPSPAGSGVALTPDMIAAAEADLGVFINFPPASSFEDFLSAILGNGIEVSNSFAIDANSGRMWVAATAPDAADGTIDGVSELGSIYGLDVVDGMGGPEIAIACRRDFVGGSASTPAIRSDGTRVYVADNDGGVLALDEDCNVVWTVDVGSQVTGSISVASDNDEIYASTQTDIVKIVDTGASGTVEWTANLAVYNVGFGFENFNTLLAGIGANGVSFMAGAGVGPGDLANLGLPLKVGYGLLDRDTGEVRYFADGLDESVAEMDAGPDGAYYNANSPIRRAFARLLYPTLTGPLEGGIRKFAPRRVDLLLRDAICAAADRAENAEANALACPDSADADGDQIDDLLAQVERMGPVAVASGDLTAPTWNRLADLVAGAQVATLANRATLLPRACAVTAPCAPAPLAGCLEAAGSSVQIRRKPDAVPNVDRFSWKWSKGAAFSDDEIGSPSVDADYGVCVYANADADPRLIYETGVPASTVWKVKPSSASWKDTFGAERGLSKIGIKGGDAGRTSVKAKATGVTWPQGTFLVTTPLVVQAVNVATGACWTSRFEAADVDQNEGTSFKARTPQ